LYHNARNGKCKKKTIVYKKAIDPFPSGFLTATLNAFPHFAKSIPCSSPSPLFYHTDNIRWGKKL